MANDSRKLLEQLMGREALYGAAPTTPKYTLKDPKICRAFVLGYCPHDTVSISSLLSQVGNALGKTTS